MTMCKKSDLGKSAEKKKKTYQYRVWATQMGNVSTQTKHWNSSQTVNWCMCYMQFKDITWPHANLSTVEDGSLVSASVHWKTGYLQCRKTKAR